MTDEILSLEFGRTFWLDEDGELRSAPTFKNGETDYEMWDYVSEWQDLEGVNLNALLDIHKTLVISKYTKQVYQGA